MLSSQRKSEILDRVSRTGTVVGAELAEEWNVSEDTIRRDLRELAAQGAIQRVHGGAVRVSPAAADYATRTNVATDAKVAVARAAVVLIEPGQTVFLDGGTTTREMCRAFPDALAATVVTHSPTVAVELVDKPSIDVLLIGGTLHRHSLVSVGAVALEYINAVAVDTFFLGVSGVHPEQGLTTGDAEEAAIKRAISRRASDTYVLASSEKIGAALPHRVVEVGDVVGAITDHTDAATLAQLEAAGLPMIAARS